MKHRSTLTLWLLFTLPVWGFSQKNYSDIPEAFRVCNQGRFHFVNVAGEGNDIKEANYCWCFENGESLGQAEKNSVWLRFSIKDGGILTFGISPDTTSDDIDFVVFKMDSGKSGRKKMVRCMAAGTDDPDNKRCKGLTGLREFEPDTREDAGCEELEDNNWLKPLSTQPGEEYLLLVSNISAAGHGFIISFGGTAQFKCAE
jgi:hypothetical protein